MTSGKGILHKEYHEKNFSKKGGDMQMVQLWVNLPAKDKMTEPKYQNIENKDLAKVDLGNGIWIRSILLQVSLKITKVQHLHFHH